MSDITKVIKFLVVGDTSKAASSFKGLSKDMKETAHSGSGLKGLGRDLRDAVKSGKGFSGIKGAFKGAATEAGGLKGMVGKVGIGMAAMGAAAVAAGVAIAIKFGADSIETFKRVAAEVSALKRVTGMTTEDASRLGFSLKQSGVDAATGNKSMTIFAKNLVKMSEADKKGKVAAAAKSEAIRGQIKALQQAGPSSKGYADKMDYLKDRLAQSTAASKLNVSALGDLGVKYTDAKGKLVPMAQLLPKIADKFAAMPDGAEKSAMAMKLFGKSGTAMIPFLNKGAAGLDELAKKSDKFGNTLTDKQLQALKDSKAAQRDWDAAMQGLQVTLGANLLPLMTQGAQMINSVLVPAFQAIAEGINNNQDLFTSFGEILRWVWNNALLPFIKAAVTGFINLQLPIAYAIQALGRLTGNKDMEKFGTDLVNAGEGVKNFVNNLQGIPEQVAPHVNVDDKASAKVVAINARIKSIKDKLAHVNAKTNPEKVAALRAEINRLQGKTVTVYVKIIGKSVKIGAMAGARIGLQSSAGNIIRAFASGGMEDHSPRVYNTRDGMRLFNEPETGGEAYIPLANDWRRPRARAIWRQTGRQLGVFAAGGINGGMAGVPLIYAPITVQGDTDPVGAGRRIARYLTDLQRATGGRALPFTTRK